ncbi:MAG TPA: hypothetical protein DCP91_09250 [Eggerthellaceae bacterium]|nr:hypothetical protein [Eggerthellaceae bacterium]
MPVARAAQVFQARGDEEDEMSEYIIELTDDELNMIIAAHGVEDCQLFGYQLTGEIVRCRDCEHFEQYRVTLKGHTWEHYWCKRDDDHLAHAEPDGFCSWGYRKENHAG